MKVLSPFLFIGRKKQKNKNLAPVSKETPLLSPPPPCWGCLPKYKLLASKNFPWNFMPIKEKIIPCVHCIFTLTSLHMKAMNVVWTIERPWWQRCQRCFLLSISATPTFSVAKGIERGNRSGILVCHTSALRLYSPNFTTHLVLTIMPLDFLFLIPTRCFILFDAFNI